MALNIDLDKIFEDSFDEVASRVKRATPDLNSAGFDPWGLDPGLVTKAAFALAPLYRKYFRVETTGLENLPKGRMIVVANHGGQIPIDGLLITLAVLLDTKEPRILRAMVERWVPVLPFINAFFVRVGEIMGHPKNCRELLERDQAVLVFPEGVKGLGKTIDERYRLKRMGTGFARLAIETGAPIVPVAVIGAEEAVPSFGQWKKMARALGLPYLPITPFFPLFGFLGLTPLPTKVTLRFGRPMKLEGKKESREADLAVQVERVKAAIEAELAIGLKHRGNQIFTKSGMSDEETAESNH